MNIKPTLAAPKASPRRVKTQRDYRRALKEIEGLMTAQRGTPAGDRLDALVALVEAWEAEHYPFDGRAT
jgi:HTH-type transcriptional regulator/antitoxin HigA